jgi:hypothetical protein
MATEQYSIGYEEGYQDGWNAAVGDAPPKREWVGLTDEQIVKSVREIGWGQSYINWTEIIEFTRYIEAKLKEKNGDTNK